MLQEYDFDIEHVAGEENGIADAFSRLVEMHDSKKTEEVNMMLNTAHVLPSNLKKIPKNEFKIISKFHNPTVGHFGAETTFNKMKESGYEWTNMREHVRLFVRRCPSCQRLDPIRPNNVTNPFVIGSYNPMEKVAIDTMGPYPPDMYGNKYLQVMVDCFSRFVMLRPAKSNDSKSAAKSLLHWVGMFGPMNELLSDMGTEFINSIVDELLKLMKVKKLDILAGSKKQNSIVERRNKEVIRHIRQIIESEKVKDHWSDASPLTQRIMNANTCDSIGCPPAKIIMPGVNLDNGIILQISDEQSHCKIKKKQRMDDYITNMVNIQSEIIRIAREQQKETHNKYFELFPIDRTSFQIGSLVLVNYGEDKNWKPPTKLHSFWRGPWRVLGIDPEDLNRYTVQHLVTNKIEDFDLKNIKGYEDSDFTDPYEAAKADLGNHVKIVQKIISHIGDIKHPSKLKFEVKWEGSVLENTHESYSELKTNECLHEYLESLGGKWRSLIPIEFTFEGEHYSEQQHADSDVIASSKIQKAGPEKKSKVNNKQPYKRTRSGKSK